MCRNDKRSEDGIVEGAFIGFGVMTVGMVVIAILQIVGEWM